MVPLRPGWSGLVRPNCVKSILPNDSLVGIPMQRRLSPLSGSGDRLLLVWLYRLYPSLLDAIVNVQPETVIRWHRRGFRAYWHWKSRHVGGRPRIDSEIRALIRRMSRENPLWGAPRIHGELLMLGIEVAESTVGRSSAADRHPKVGRPFCEIMPLALLRWICS